MGNRFVLPYTTFEGNPEWGYKWKGNLHTVFGRISHPSFVPFDPYLIYYSVVSHQKKERKKKEKKLKGAYTMLDSKVLWVSWNDVLFVSLSFVWYAKILYRKSTFTWCKKYLVLYLAITIWNTQCDTLLGIETDCIRDNCSYPSFKENYHVVSSSYGLMHYYCHCSYYSYSSYSSCYSYSS